MQNNNLTRFDEGGTHEQNPLGGIPQGIAPNGSQNLVESGETKKGNFIYSNRITLDPNRIKQFNLPGYAANKSVSDASKAIENKFKDRNDKYAEETKKSLLDRLANAQESVKAEQAQTQQAMQTNSQSAPEDMMGGQVPEGMEEFIKPQQSQPMAAYGGMQRKYDDGGYIQGDANLDGVVDNLDSTDAITPSINAGGIVGGAGALLGLGQTAFGKSSQDTSGANTSGRVGAAGMIGGSALKGASAGSAFGPLGAGIGAAVGGLAGIAGLGKTRRAEALNTQNFALNSNRALSDNYAAYGGTQNVYKYANGGMLIDPRNQIKPSINPVTITPSQLPNTVQSLTGINSIPVNQNMNFNTKQIVRYQPGVTNDKMGQGFYLYSKNVSDPGFNVTRDREFVKQSEMGAVQRTPEWSTYMKGQAANKQYANGGDMNVPGKPDAPQYMKDLEMNPDLVPKTFLNNFGEGVERFENPNLKVANYIQGDANLSGNVDKADTIDKFDNSIITPRYKSSLNKIGTNITDNIGEALRYSPIAANLLQLKNLKKPTGVQYQTLANRYKPFYVDEAQGRNIIDAEGNAALSAITQSGASQGAARNAILAASLNKTKALGDITANAVAQNRMQDAQAQQFNANIDQANVATANKSIDEMRADQAAYDNIKSKIIANTGTAVGSIGKEIADSQLASSLTGYTRKGKYLYKPDGTKVTPEEMIKIKSATQSSSTPPTLKKGDKYTDENGIVQTFKYGGYLNLKNNK